MVGQGKTMWQADIDAAAETIDFLRFNSYYASSLFLIFLTTQNSMNNNHQRIQNTFGTS
jgi:1-pyrroline-5-carboxylate dehydrogenase